MLLKAWSPLFLLADSWWSPQRGLHSWLSLHRHFPVHSLQLSSFLCAAGGQSSGSTSDRFFPRGYSAKEAFSHAGPNAQEHGGSPGRMQAVLCSGVGSDSLLLLRGTASSGAAVWGPSEMKVLAPGPHCQSGRDRRLPSPGCSHLLLSFSEEALLLFI